MTPIGLLTIAASVLLSAVSQILLKHGMVSAPVREALAQGSLPRIVTTIALTPTILLGFTCFGVSTLVWLWVLARTPLSTAYPFVALGIAVTVTAGLLLFGEPLSVQKLLGVAVILIGIITLATA